LVTYAHRDAYRAQMFLEVLEAICAFIFLYAFIELGR
jgi:hypothetical protein